MARIRIGTGYDVHRFSEAVEATTVKICGVSLAYERSIVAHSDGDVGIHALVDALLGACALGDIGMHFPPSDPQWENADSIDFLTYTINLLKDNHMRVGNVDITIICERPKIRNSVEEMRRTLAAAMQIRVEDVSIKATTTEKTGALGRSEAIAAQAVALIEQIV